MNSSESFLKRYWWPISALLFCPCHLPLSMGFIALASTGTAFGAWLTRYYAPIESTLAITFSFYFVIAFLIWAVRGPRSIDGSACVIDENGHVRPQGFSTRQVVLWGIGSAFIMPTLVTISFLTRSGLVRDIFNGSAGFDVTESGFIWLVSISAIVMIPVMVVWIAWMYISWMKVDPDSVEQWDYEYEYD